MGCGSTLVLALSLRDGARRTLATPVRFYPPLATVPPGVGEIQAATSGSGAAAWSAFPVRGEVMAAANLRSMNGVQRDGP